MWFGRVLAGSSIAAAIVLHAAPVHACSCDFSGPGHYYLVAGGGLPHDARGIPWHGLHELRRPEDPPRSITDRVTLTQEIDGKTITIPFTVTAGRGDGDRIDILVPDEKFKPGSKYTVTVREYGGHGRGLYDRRDRYTGPKKRGKRVEYPPFPFLHENTATITILDEVPDVRGASLKLSPRSRQEVTSWGTNGGCMTRGEADIIDLNVELPPALEPYRDYLVYSTRVDGQLFSHVAGNCDWYPDGRSWLAKPGVDRLFSDCGEKNRGLTPGEHRVAITLSTPDGLRSFTTPEVMFTIGCNLSPASAAVVEVVDPVQAGPEPAPPPTPAPRGCSLGAPAWGWPLVLLLRRRRGR